MVSGFELGFWLVARVGTVVKEAMCDGPSDSFVEEEKKESDFEAFVGEAVAVVFAIALEQAVGFEFSQIVA